MRAAIGRLHQSRAAAGDHREARVGKQARDAFGLRRNTDDRGLMRALPNMLTAGRMPRRRSVASGELCHNAQHPPRFLPVGRVHRLRIDQLRNLVRSDIMPCPSSLLVDGSSYLYRAFHALPDLRTSRGEPTGAIRGVVSMLRRLVEDGKPDYFAVVFDAPGKTFRDDWYPQYKANRPPMPDDLVAQIEPLHELIARARLAAADDRRRRGRRRDRHARARRRRSRHRLRHLDRRQGPGAARCARDHAGQHDEQRDARRGGVLAKFGVRADQILDLLALTGDAVDNVPGVPKVGPKTAAKWLAQYGTLDSVIAHADEIGGVVGENLRAALDWLPQGRRLLTVQDRLRAAGRGRRTSCRARPMRRSSRRFYERFEFKSWLQGRRAADGCAAAIAVASRQEVTGAISRRAERSAPTAHRRRRCRATTRPCSTRLRFRALDRRDRRGGRSCASTPRRRASIRCRRGSSACRSSIEPGHACYIPLAHRYAGAPEQLPLDARAGAAEAVVRGSDAKKLGQNVKYDQHVLANHGIALAGVAHDTLLESYVLESHRPHDMDSLAWRHLDVKTITYAEVAGKGANQIGFDQVAHRSSDRVLRRGRRHHAAAARALYPQDRGRCEARLRLLDDRAADARGAVPHGAQRRAASMRALLAAQSRELGERMHGARAAGVPARRAAVQSRVARSSSARSCSIA